MSSSTLFWDRIAERYARKPVKDESAYRRKLGITRRYFEPDMSVLEFGCGTGSTALEHAPYVSHILATDASARMIEIAESKRLAAGIDNVTFRVADAGSLPPSDDGYDAVLGLSILHLLDDLDATVRMVAGALKPGGVFVSNTACIADKWTILPYIATLGRRLGLLPYVSIFSSEALFASLANAGFSIEHHWPLDNGMTHFVVARIHD